MTTCKRRADTERSDNHTPTCAVGMAGWPYRPLRRTLLPAIFLLLIGCLTSGCETEAPPLQLADLTKAEHQYLQRVIQLERAKAVALVDAATGTALLDSLAAAWGDSSLVETKALSPQEPKRSAAVAELLLRILAAENDSLIHAPRPDRLSAPLPDPVAPTESDDPSPAASG